MATLSGSFNLSGTITSSGDLLFTTAGSGVVQPVTSIIPTGTASFVAGTTIVEGTNSTTFLQYGINLIETATSQSYCVKLPQVPKTGKQVTVINKSGVDLWAFPSTGSGEINGDVDGYLVIPSNGQTYTFDCYENPLPGGWSSATYYPSGVQVHLTGIISSSIGAWFSSTSGSSVLAYINNTTKQTGLGNTSISLTGNYDPFLNNQWGNLGVQGDYVGSYYLPNQTWKRINSIQIYTNITGSLRGSIQPGITLTSTQWLLYQGGTSTYAPNYNYWQDPSWTAFKSSTYDSWISNNVSTDTFWGNMSTSWIGGHTPSVVPGTFIPTTPGSVYSTAVGGPGTAKYTMFFNPNVDTNQVGKMIGKTLIGTYYSSVLGYNVDVWTKRQWGFLLKNYSSNITQIQVQARLALILA
jgi:hypothetical protein